MDQRPSRQIAKGLLFTSCAGVIFIFTILGTKTNKDVLRPYLRHYLSFQYSSFSDDSTFYTEAFHHAIQHKINSSIQNKWPIRLGIVSHHLLIKDLIADYFARLTSAHPPSTIILIGPNHRSRGKHSFAVSELPWKTPIGIVYPNQSIIQRLLRTRLVELDEDAFYDEHSIGALVPFIRNYFPKALIVPIIIKPDADTSQVLNLASWIAGNTFLSNTLVLASLDFSHYQTSAIAQRQDETSLRIIRSLRLDLWKEVYVDSRKTLLIILKYAVLTHSEQFEIIHHTNSGILEKKPEEPCTSYINSVFRSCPN